ncbi:ABC transporter ATP-binding protein [Synechococcus sp. PCC 7336]|uniref:ABC transporter ATP-binding protein n=1 Tax=Synechococcus sp. PCC 7336 TaxID=195250 RepID=UPI000375F7CC|nr:ABC transporter ATP-binding protein [Synechococcus sp. PCC 7336]
MSKTYRTGFWLNKVVTPLKDCTLTVARGETYGLLGPNGAGKTTTIKCLLGIIQASSGSGTILDCPLGDPSIKQQVGYLPENAYLYDYLTGWEFLQFSGELFQIPRKVLKERIPQLLEEVGLPVDTARNRQLRKYSKGMMQRVGMAQALINNPELVFLDEPMSGLDPVGRAQFREIILNLKRQGKTVFFNSHVLSDVEAICDRVGLLIQGDMVAQGTLEELLASQSGYRVRGIGGELESLSRQLQNWELLSPTSASLESALWSGDWLGQTGDCTTMLQQLGAQLVELRQHKQSLEDFFLHEVRARQAEAADKVR